LELKTDRFLEPEICRALVEELYRTGIRDQAVILSFSLPRIQAVQAIAPDIPSGWITLSRPWPRSGAQVLGPFWPLLLLNPFYVHFAHREGQLVCPLDPKPDSRLRLYLRLGCDAILSDDPGATALALERLAGRPARS
jgi:glycerophosphoryl diester phosphodiesterase